MSGTYRNENDCEHEEEDQRTLENLSVLYRHSLERADIAPAAKNISPAVLTHILSLYIEHSLERDVE